MIYSRMLNKITCVIIVYPFYYFLKIIYLFIYLAVLGLSCNTQDVHCITRDLFRCGRRVQLLQGMWDLSALPRD